MPASFEDLLRVHAEGYVREVAALSATDGVSFLSPDTYIGPGTFEVARYAAGSAVAAAGHALLGEHCFALVRPPGHHATRDRAMGFCIFNNAAVAAAAALDAGMERVAILDWDLHHGNGTQSNLLRLGPGPLLLGPPAGGVPRERLGRRDRRGGREGVSP